VEGILLPEWILVSRGKVMGKTERMDVLYRRYGMIVIRAHL
jgi:hypothetical protein